MATTNRQQDNNGVQIKVMKALNDGKWTYRTLNGIAKEADLPPTQVYEVLVKNKAFVRKSLVRRSDGQDLYTSKEKVNGLQDVWTAVRALSRAKLEK